MRTGLCDLTGHAPKLSLTHCAMESPQEPMYGQGVSPTEAGAPAEVGNPNTAGFETDVRDEAGRQTATGGAVQANLEEQARSMLEGCDGLEPPYEYMSVEGTPDRSERELPAEQNAAVDSGPANFQVGRQSLSEEKRDGPMLNGVAPGSHGGEASTGGTNLEAAGVMGAGPPTTQQGGFEELIRQLVRQNEALHEELAWARQQSSRTSHADSEAVGMYRSQGSERRTSNGSVEVGEGRGSHVGRVSGKDGGIRGKGIGSPNPGFGGWTQLSLSERSFRPPWTQFAPSNDAATASPPSRPLQNLSYDWPQNDDGLRQMSLNQASSHVHDGFRNMPLDQTSSQMHDEVRHTPSNQASSHVHDGFRHMPLDQPPGQMHDVFRHMSSSQISSRGYEGNRFALSGQVFGQARDGFRHTPSDQDPSQVHGFRHTPSDQDPSQVHDGFRHTPSDQDPSQARDGFRRTPSDHDSNQAHDGFRRTHSDQVPSQVHDGFRHTPSEPASGQMQDGFRNMPSSQASSQRCNGFRQMPTGQVLGQDQDSVQHLQSSQVPAQGPDGLRCAQPSPTLERACASGHQGHGEDRKIKEKRGPSQGLQVAEKGEADVSVRKITVVVDGVPREGIVDASGAVQVTNKGPEYFSIASEEPEQLMACQSVTPRMPPLPSFGRADPEPDNPFNPKARSPFRPTPPPPPPGARADTENGESTWVPPRPNGSPPRTRSPSPATPRRRPTLARRLLQVSDKWCHVSRWVAAPRHRARTPGITFQGRGQCGSCQSLRHRRRITRL